MGPAAVSSRLLELPGWAAPRGRRLVRRFRTKDFDDALAFVVRIGAIAKRRDHHPDVTFGWGYVEPSVWTHSAGGVTELDFELAAAITRAA
jgi:4a-hydroxytetrahydrobiopterin dehydratase